MVVNYPNKKDNSLQKNKKANDFSMSNRGMSLELLLNQANEYYRSHNIACIYKKPTPVQVVRVDYQKRSQAKIIEAYYSTPSTTDYNGVYNGYYIDFEAKQTKLTALPFHNFHLHQIEHMEQVIKQNGICFVVVYFSKYERCFVLPALEIIRHYRNNQLRQKKQPFSLQLFITYGYEITGKTFPILDYLTLVKKHIIGGITSDN